MIATRSSTAVRVVTLGGLALALAGCGSTAGGSGPGPLGNLLAFGAEGPPPVAAEAPIDVLDCPPVTVAEGAAAARGGAGGQVSISDLARECTGRRDGTVLVKVGVQLRALLGPGGASGRFDTPVSIVVRRGDQVLSSRTRRVAITIPAGQAESTTSIVEDGLVVPPGTGEFEVEVALRAGAAAAPARRRGRG
jgi:hypothetical protein